MKNFTWQRGVLGCAALVAITVLGLARIDAGQGAGAGRGGGPDQGQTANPDDWRIDPMRGPVDLGLTDPSLVGAIDVHQHLDPDAPGAGGQIGPLTASTLRFLRSSGACAAWSSKPIKIRRRRLSRIWCGSTWFRVLRCSAAWP